MVAASAQIAPSVETKPLVLKPLFERSPAKFWGAHQDNMLFDLHLARKTDASLSLNQVIARYPESGLEMGEGTHVIALEEIDAAYIVLAAHF